MESLHQRLKRKGQDLNSTAARIVATMEQVDERPSNNEPLAIEARQKAYNDVRGELKLLKVEMHALQPWPMH